ncbi:glycoside hydrolase [Rubricoccus marinus]|uniref:Glycoside hydrolase n=1 Tax=Rubricoccus marinus TaxID=716817 RepID=A0A259TUF5_9BACT|nr:glycoside hydrolase [Rubricoccus marinus]
MRLFSLLLLAPLAAFAQPADFALTERGYFEREGVSVMAFQDFYPDSHQGGITVVQHGIRIAANGDLRLGATPGQWDPVPKQDSREEASGEIVTRLSYPDPGKNRRGFNPIEYPDLEMGYAVRARAEGDAIVVTVDLDTPLPTEYVGQVGFILELFPVDLFGKSWMLGDARGQFPRQPNGPTARSASGEAEAIPFARGRSLTVAPETDDLRLTIESRTGELALLDGRTLHNNGWFIVRETVPAGATSGAIEWTIRPHAIPGWVRPPVVQVSQVGYHPAQRKTAVIEHDARDTESTPARLVRITASGAETIREATPEAWDGDFLRYDYRLFDFSDVTQPGLYAIEYRGERTHAFQISPEVYARDVWQPTVDYFLPVQMCHMRVEDPYRLWHGACHLDDARMAPADSNHFDGYVQGAELLAPFEHNDRVPGLDVGGWHDAGDDDLRIESQADEVWVLASAYEAFDALRDYDDTTIRQQDRFVKIHQPDGVPDLLQQIEHGTMNIVGGVRSLGRFYRGVIVPTLEQYRMIGDFAGSTDNLAYDPDLAPEARTATASGVADDRMVFTEQNAGHEYKGIAALAIAARVLAEYNPPLAREAREAAERLWAAPRDDSRGFADKVAAGVELFLTTGGDRYRQWLLASQDQIVAQIGRTGWTVGRAVPRLGDAGFERAVRQAVASDFSATAEAQRSTPYGVPYEPNIWGAGWDIQAFGVRQYFLHRAFPETVSAEYMLNALNFILGVHPGANTASFASGVGAHSVERGYGLNRADYAYIPGGVASGTALIRPDFPELKDFPYLWQQAEYVMGGGATHFMVLALAADQILNAE